MERKGWWKKCEAVREARRKSVVSRTRSRLWKARRFPEYLDQDQDSLTLLSLSQVLSEGTFKKSKKRLREAGRIIGNHLNHSNYSSDNCGLSVKPKPPFNSFLNTFPTGGLDKSWALYNLFYPVI